MIVGKIAGCSTIGVSDPGNVNINGMLSRLKITIPMSSPLDPPKIYQQAMQNTSSTVKSRIG